MTQTPNRWDEDTIRLYLESAINNAGHGLATLPTEYDAKCFRLRLYKYRAQHQIGQDLVIKVDGCRVIITPAAAITPVEIAQPAIKDV